MKIDKLLETAIKAAVEGGKAILNIYNDPDADFSVEKKADNSPLTIADKASHKTIIELLQQTEFPILSEEGKDIPFETRKNWPTFWLVDPLDGTKEFIKRNNEFTVNIALIHKGNPVMGVIYVPVTGALYIGETETGAWRIENINEPVSIETVKTRGTQLPAEAGNGKYKVVGSRSHLNDETRDYIKKLEKEHPDIEVVSKGSSLKICMVAEGAANEYPRFGPTMEWDTAAGHAIANAAGKKLLHTDFSGELNYNKKNLLNPYFIVR